MITVFNRGTSPSLSDERWKSSAWVLAAFQNRSLPLPCPNAALILQPALSWIYISLFLFTWHQLERSAHFSVEKRGFDRPNIENELKMSSNPSRKWTWKWLLGCEQHPWASWPSSVSSMFFWNSITVSFSAINVIYPHPNLNEKKCRVAQQYLSHLTVLR